MRARESDKERNASIVQGGFPNTSVDINQLMTGILVGAIIGFLHTIVADGLVATLMTGHFFYFYGGSILFIVISEIVKNIIMGGILGAIGAYIALVRK